MKKLIIILFCLTLFGCGKSLKEQGCKYKITYQCSGSGYCNHIYCAEYILMPNGCVEANGTIVCGSYNIEKL